MARDRLPFLARVATSLALLPAPGCRSCDPPPAPPPPAPVVSPAPPPLPPPEPTTEPTPTVAPYAGPSSRAADGYQISTGFLDAAGQPLPQPRSASPGDIFVTALDARGRPVGALGDVGGAQLHGFLLARDLRHALAATATAPVREGADARGLRFTPPAGGDHALVAVFAPPGADVHAVIAPVSVSGNLPQLQGPGLGGLGMQSHTATEHVALTVLPADRTPTAPLELALHDLGKDGRVKGPLAVPFAVLVDPAMGRAIVLLSDKATGRLPWSQVEPGDWLVLAPPPRGDRALAFHLTLGPGPQQK